MINLLKTNSMKKLQRYISLFTLILALAATSLSTYLVLTKPKTAYVNLTNLYNEFGLKKQLEQQLVSVTDIRQKQIDSLELSLNILSRNLQSIDQAKDKALYQSKAIEFDGHRQEFLYKKKSFADDNATLSEQYTSQIWKQLNQYVKDYGDAHGYTYIMGGDGTGTMMYADHGEDLTETLIAYTNDRYKGESKN